MVWIKAHERKIVRAPKASSRGGTHPFPGGGRSSSTRLASAATTVAPGIAAHVLQFGLAANEIRIGMGRKPKDQAEIEDDPKIPGDQEIRGPLPAMTYKRGDSEHKENDDGEKKPPPGQ